MSILFPEGSKNFLLSLKLILVSTTVLSAAVALKLSVPAIADFAVSDVPSIYNGVVSWLRPPYLYLVINCIIITILATSMLQSKLDEVESPSVPPLQTMSLTQVYHPQPEPGPGPVPVPPQGEPLHQPIKHRQLDDDDDIVLKDGVVEAAAVRMPQVFEYDNNIITDLNLYEVRDLENDKEFVSVNAVDMSPEVEMSSNRDEFVRNKLSRALIRRTDSSEFSFSNEKPPLSARFGHRRAVKASPEGGKAALGVAKPKRQDTLESTWKTITEGRAMPLTRHLRKSDTWETHGGRQHNHHIQAPQNPTMIKSETFSDGSRQSNNSANSPLRSPSPGSGKLKREASLSQDELNRRVEAFIKKFNEEMRLQRQESLNQYMEMINRGAH